MTAWIATSRRCHRPWSDASNRLREENRGHPCSGSLWDDWRGSYAKSLVKRVDKGAKAKGVSEEETLKDMLEGDVAAEKHYDEKGEGGEQFSTIAYDA